MILLALGGGLFEEDVYGCWDFFHTHRLEVEQSVERPSYLFCLSSETRLNAGKVKLLRIARLQDSVASCRPRSMAETGIDI